ncbi:MAG: hypothetical protein LAP85_25960 [Acidobacteriia bacterium]|nr:hypothetical protein [Terriglobia bacterium]
MFFSRRKLIMAAVVAAAAAIVLVTQIGASNSDQGAMKLEGAWVARVTSMNGHPFPAVSQWSYVFSPDASGRSAAIHGSIDVGFFPNQPGNTTFSTPLIGEAVSTGPDTATFKVIWYTISQSGPGQFNQVVLIGTASGAARSVGPGKVEVTDDFKIYLASADADGDGFPDEGSTPIRSFTVTTLDTRIPSPGR